MQKDKIFDIAILNIKTTSNNTIINISDLLGNVLYILSAGNLGFKGSKKKTSFAAQKVVEKIILKLSTLNVKKVKIFLKGVSYNRDFILNNLSSLKIISIYDLTPISYNGCRPKKKRRI